MGIQHQRFQFRVWQYLDTNIVIVAEIRLAHPCSSSACRAVEENLDSADRQHAVTNAGHKTCFIAFLHDGRPRIAEQYEPGAHWQTLIQLGEIIGADFIETCDLTDSGIHDAGYAIGKKQITRSLNGLDHLFRRCLGDGLADSPLSIFGNHTCQGAIFLLNQPALWHRRTFVNTCQFKCL